MISVQTHSTQQARMRRPSFRQVIADKGVGDAPLAHDVALSTRSSWRDASALCQREKIAHLLRVFSSARRRPALAADEVVIFLAIGHLSISVENDAVVIRPIGLTEIALLLGIPKETVRRKTLRLADVEYVACSPKGIVLKQLDIWCRMFDRMAR